MKVIISHGTAFQISDEKGNIPSGQEYGLYYQDIRFLNYFNLTINGKELLFLDSGTIDYYSAIYYLTNPEVDGIGAETLSVIRTKFVGEGMHEDIDVINHSEKSLRFRLKFEIAVDFADIFEVKLLNIKKEGKIEVIKEPQGIIFRYIHGDFIRKTLVSFDSATQPKIEGTDAIFELELSPKASWHSCINFCVGEEKNMCQLMFKCNSFNLVSLPYKEDAEKWFSNIPILESDYDALNHAYKQSLVDLVALRIRDKKLSGDVFIPAAGIPWFSTLFGRDSLIVAYQTVIINPEIARGTLKTLTRFQGKELNGYKEEEPGKILHEIRFGELAYLGRIPHTPYYGTVDATALFLIVAFEYYSFTHDLEFIREILPGIKSALIWIDEYGDRDKDGYVEYKKSTDEGLDNQGWKDSRDSIIFKDGIIAEPPIALCEVQGYVYRAKRGMSRLFRELGEDKLASKLGRDADRLKENFNKDYWLGEEKYFAQALDEKKRRVDSITSNCGQLLWSGIVDKDKAGCVAKRLMMKDMFSGWGIRTLSANCSSYNPLSYHNGSVWPFDNSLIVEGLRNYGFDNEAGIIIQAMIEAATYFSHHRLPELFCGYHRTEGRFPVEYPTSCSPQAWSTGAISLFVKTLLGLRPDKDDKYTFWIRPSLLNDMDRLSFRNIPILDTRLNVDVHIDKGEKIVDYKIGKGRVRIRQQ